MYCTILFMETRLLLYIHRCTNTIDFTRTHTSKDINQITRADASGSEGNGGGKWDWASGVEGAKQKEGPGMDSVPWTKASDKFNSSSEVHTHTKQWIPNVIWCILNLRVKIRMILFCLKWGGCCKSTVVYLLVGIFKVFILDPTTRERWDRRQALAIMFLCHLQTGKMVKIIWMLHNAGESTGKPALII